MCLCTLFLVFSISGFLLKSIFMSFLFAKVKFVLVIDNRLNLNNFSINFFVCYLWLSGMFGSNYSVFSASQNDFSSGIF